MGNDQRRLLSRDVVSTDGARLGHVADLYVDPDTGATRWLVVHGGLLSSAVSFVPAPGIREDDDGRLVVAYTRRQVRRAPHPSADGQLDADDEAALLRHYGDPSVATPQAGDFLADPTTTSEQSLVRAEEDVEVGSTIRPVHRARLVKTVVTEHVTFTVPVRREVVRIEYDEIPEDEIDLVAEADGRQPFDTLPDHELVLYAEIVEYEKRIVPKERVRLRHEVLPEVLDLRTELRKEEVDVAEVPTT